MGKRRSKYALLLAAGLCLIIPTAAGCGNGEETAEAETVESGAAESGDVRDGDETDKEKSGLAHETAADGHVDFEALQQENPDIFAWLYVPGTDIDTPVLQSPVSDGFYQNHTSAGEEGQEGALYTEMPNMMNMCDFNTVIHGKDSKESDLFASLHRFEEPEFFEENEKFYLYLPDNVLTYEVFAAYYDEGSDILRRFDYTTYAGCEAYLRQVYGSREMGKQQREGWDDLTPYHFIVTLNGEVRDGEDKQYVVLGALVGDAAGKIDRMILD